MIRRPWDKRTEVEALVTPWTLMGKHARAISLFGIIRSNLDTTVNSDEGSPLIAENIYASLMLLAAESNEPVKIFINSGGGSIGAGLLIVEAVEHLRAKNIDVEMVVLEGALSMASVILAAGTKGKRFAHKRSVIHLHSGHEQMGGRPEDVEKIKRHFNRTRDSLVNILLSRTRIAEFYAKQEDLKSEVLESEEGKRRCVEKFLEAEVYLSAPEAMEAGIIDAILESGSEQLDHRFTFQEN